MGRRSLGRTVAAAASSVVLLGCGGAQSGGQDAAPAAPVAAAPDSAAAPVERYTFPGEGVFPEGIAVTEDGTFFVGSTADGTIYRGQVGQEGLEVLAEGGDQRPTAVGMTVADTGGGLVLIVAGGATGQAYVVDARTGEQLGVYDTGVSETFVNDVVMTPGAAYLTDSFAPVLYRLPAAEDGFGELEVFVDLTGTPFSYGDGINANGIAATSDGRFLVVVQSSTGELFRVSTVTEEVVQVDLDGETFVNGDGLVLDETNDVLYVVQNAEEAITAIQMVPDLSSGEVIASTSPEVLRHPTTAALFGEWLLVVNAQFDQRDGEPELPFDVVAIDPPA